MKKQASVLFFVLSCLMGIAGGCAKQGMVKSEEPVVSQSTAKQSRVAEPKEPQPKSELKADSAKLMPNDKTSNPESEEGRTLDPIPRTGELRIALETIYFDFDSSVLSQEARQTLVKNADKIKQDSKVMIKIEGNCDERGSDEYNLALGERRARSAMQYLVTMGVPEERLSVISYGKEKPAAAGHDEASWAKNRRDEFEIMTE